MRKEAETREDECGGGTDTRGQAQAYRAGKIDGVPLGRMATAAPMAPTPYLAEERPTKKRPTQRIRRGIAEAATVS